jgi:hypothetical protein
MKLTQTSFGSILFLIAVSTFSAPTFASVGDVICGPVALKREDSTEFKRLDSTLIMAHIDDTVNDFNIAQEFSASDFKDAKFEGKLFLRAKGQRLGASYPEGLKGKFVLTLSYLHYTLDADSHKVGHGSGYSQGNVFEPLTGIADGDDPVLKGAGATCMFFPITEK